MASQLSRARLESDPVALTRGRILAAARALTAASTSGRGATIGQVAGVAGVSRATVYRHFATRAGLRRAVREVDSERAPHSGGNGAVAWTPREQILEAALAIFEERGLHATTLRHVAERAGLSLSGVHWYFKNKGELVAALADYLRVMPTIVAEAALAGDAAAPDLETQLARIAESIAEALSGRGGFLRLAICEAVHHPDVARLAMQHTVGRALPLVASIFDEHVRRGTVSPGPSLVRAQAFMGMVVSRILLDPLVGPLLPDLGACSREYVHVMVRGVLESEARSAMSSRAAP
jgi:AcrR family transcriptional regulator